MSAKYDLVIIGGGPAGLAAGLEALSSKARVLMIEREKEIGQNVHCAEGLTVRSLSDIIPLDPGWILTSPKNGRLFAPGGRIIEVSDPDGGLVLDRSKMEADLAAQYVKLGGELKTGCRAVKLIESDNIFSKLIIEDEYSNQQTINSKFFIAADGVESRIARSAGLRNYLNREKNDAFIQYRLSRIEVDPKAVEIHIGQNIAPGSYAWVFPRGERVANVGLGLYGKFKAGRQGREFLDQFVARCFPGSVIERVSCGMAPRFAGLDNLTKANLLVVGDAARLVDSLTGAGICTALHSGQLAARAIGCFMNRELKTIDKVAQQYSHSVKELYEGELKRLLKIKKIFCKLSDKELDSLLECFEESQRRGEVDSFDLFGFVLSMIKTKPRLIGLARHLF